MGPAAVNDLVAFIHARLDEDEQAAKRVRQPYRLYVDNHGRISEPKRIDDLHGDRDGEYEQWADGEDRMPNDIASWSLIYDPARVLREVAAKRGIAEEAEAIWNSDIDGAYGRGMMILNLLALSYADHPDYREEWAP